MNIKAAVGVFNNMASSLAAKKGAPQAVVSGATDAIGTATKNVDDMCEAVSKFSSTVNRTKDSFVSSKAQSNVKKMIGDVTTVASEEEKFRKQLIDSQFSEGSNLFTRVKNSFIPQTFPSGKKVAIKQSAMNEIISNAEKGKNTHFSYTGRDGSQISGFVSKMTQRQGEDCFVSKFVRTAADNAKETVEVRYYPKSAQIKSVSKDIDGTKTINGIIGNENGGRLVKPRIVEVVHKPAKEVNSIAAGSTPKTIEYSVNPAISQKIIAEGLPVKTAAIEVEKAID